ncbi:hypothetical protein [Flammeovirga agarivorans]|uniref:Uncharacterized protein n=1 Tax=Flammeovirga agarivorans TaxID=2726742 RepID=A0A7X8SJB4_9BACT|nr:hypothetical protein [Flammeovirga agarivorans]NLR91182.1 hypothetical protein [Flammeovirga agarivorans]
MTKQIFVLLVIVFSSCISSSQKNFKKTASLKGEVVKIIEKKYDTKLKKGVFRIVYQADLSQDIYHYNQANSITHTQFLDYKGKEMWRYENSFDKNGNIISSSVFMKNELNNTFENKFVDGENIESVYLDADGKKLYTTLKEYEGKALSKKTKVSIDGEVLLITEYDNKDGVSKSITEKLPNGKVKRFTKYEYNHFGDLTKEEVVIEDFNQKENDIRYFEYEYDQNGNWTKKFYYNDESVLEDVSIRNIFYSDDQKLKLSKSLLLGEWFVFGRKIQSFVFNEDNTFQLIHENRSKASGIWSFDAKKSNITLTQESEKDELVLNCFWAGGLLHLYPEDITDQVMQLERRTPNIDQKFTQKVAEKPFLGKWQVVGEDEMYIEFTPENHFLTTQKSKTPKKGTWEINIDNRLITFTENGKEESKKYHYFFEEGQLKFYNYSLEVVQTLNFVGNEM